MKKREEVSKLPRRRDAALAVPYKKDEFISPSDDRKFSKAKSFTSTSLKINTLKSSPASAPGFLCLTFAHLKNITNCIY